MLSEVHKNEQNFFLILPKAPDEYLLMLFKFSSVICQLRAYTARTYLQYCILVPVAIAQPVSR